MLRITPTPSVTPSDDWLNHTQGGGAIKTLAIAVIVFLCVIGIARTLMRGTGS